MGVPNPRRWYQFSLRTFFVLVTLVCVGFGYWVHWSREWIRQRHEWLAEPHSTGVPLKREVRAPAGLWLFGEEGKGDIWCQTEEVELARRLFPEAAINDFFSNDSKSNGT